MFNFSCHDLRNQTMARKRRCFKLILNATLIFLTVFIIMTNIDIHSISKRIPLMNFGKSSPNFKISTHSTSVSSRNNKSFNGGFIFKKIIRTIATTDYNDHFSEVHQSTESSPLRLEKSKTIFNGKTYKRPHLMTVGGAGRLGNQMFQYATLLGVAKMHGYTPFVSTNHVIRNVFDIGKPKSVHMTHTKRIGEWRAGAYYKEVEHLSHDWNWTLHGYYQSWRYFDHVADHVRKSLKFKLKIKTEAKDYIDSFKTGNGTKVGVHVRRGDMNTRKELSRGYNVANALYLHKAIAYFRAKLYNPTFIMISDDMSWVKQNVRGHDVKYAITGKAPVDLAILSMCDHSIITSGTFGWWGAYLAGGQTIYYNDFPKRGSWLEKQYERTDYYPSNWMGLD